MLTSCSDVEGVTEDDYEFSAPQFYDFKAENSVVKSTDEWFGKQF